MITIKTTEALKEYCERARDFPYVTVDTEFLRERTYYSKLCLIQLAVKGDDDEQDAVLVDPIGTNIDLSPLYELFRDENVVKVFHAARQDLEIFCIQGNVIPKPLFDTQVAAMVCGFGEQVGYETLVRKIADQPLDKSSRFTDWSRRPLTPAQEKYALADVTHLRMIYEVLSDKIADQGRGSWVQEELQVLLNADTYRVAPENAWKRVKTRTNSPKFLSILKELAAFREAHAQTRDIPRNRVFKDDVILELASTKPSSMEDLSRSRLLTRDGRKGVIADGILAAIARGIATLPEDMPKVDKNRDMLNVNPALADMLRVLLKAKSDQFNVAARMIASSSDLDEIAAGKRDVDALTGWRADVFGADALRLCSGEVGLGVKGSRVQIIEI